MKFNCGPKYKRGSSWYQEAVAKAREWSDVFAWWPTRVADNDCRWLETIQRRCVGGKEWLHWMTSWNDNRESLSRGKPFSKHWLDFFWDERPAIEYRAKSKESDGA